MKNPLSESLAPAAEHRKKEAVLRPHLLASVKRLLRFIEMDAPGVIVGSAAWLVFKCTLACYGSRVGITLLDDLMEGDLSGRGLCTHGDCIEAVTRPDVPICQACQKELGMDDASLRKILAEIDGEGERK